MIRIFTLLICFLFSAIYGYDQNPHVNPEVWEKISPYFLPEDHPIKPKLDNLFSQRITANSRRLKKAGFEEPEPRKLSKTIVTKHKKIKGYYFKLFTDDQSIDDGKQLYTRVLGAERVKNCINRNQLDHLCKVPQKWIYPLPENPPPSKPLHRKNFILIAEDMELYTKEENLMKWGNSTLVTTELLDAIYLLLQEEGLKDSIYPFNMPFSKIDHKIAFIDLEKTREWPIRFKRLIPYLSPEMALYWSALILPN
ncbi:MAG TPA: hypothetical protein VIH61_04535 [Waddliaceae bacterium]